MGAGARLRPEDRREQLLAAGLELVGARSFEGVSMEDVAAAARVSRTLVFHYFPSKRAFQVAVAQRATDELVRAARPDPTLPALEQLRAGVRTYLDFVEARPGAYLSLVRGAGGGDAELRRVTDGARAELADLVLDGVGLPARERPPLLHLAVRGWLAAVEEMVVLWLSEGGAGREDLVEVAVASLLGSASALLDEQVYARLVGDGHR
jgi:AcrR family transcriptional regulator